MVFVAALFAGIVVEIFGNWFPHSTLLLNATPPLFPSGILPAFVDVQSKIVFPLCVRIYTVRQAEMHPGWLAELRGEHIPETEEYGISSFVYRRRRPFHPERFLDFVENS